MGDAADAGRDELTLAEAADLLETSADLVEELVRERRLSARRDTGTLWLSRTELLEHWIVWQRTQAHARAQADIINRSAGGWDY